MEWERISNQACSHKNGWIEKVPGTCTAGGPPPLCPQDHWILMPGAAAGQWIQLESEVYNRRKNEILDLLCGCWRDEVESRYSVESKALLSSIAIKETNSPAPKATNSNTMKLPCIGNPPPGFECEGGFLVQKNSPVKTYSTSSAENFCNLKLNVLIPHFNDLATVLKSGLDNFTVSANAQIPAGSYELSTWYIAYCTDLSKVKKQIDDYKFLVNEYLQRKNLQKGKSCNCRTLEELDPLIESQINLMINTFATVNVDYSGIMQEEKQCPNCCFTVFEDYHKWLTLYFIGIKNNKFKTLQ